MACFYVLPLPADGGQGSTGSPSALTGLAPWSVATGSSSIASPVGATSAYSPFAAGTAHASAAAISGLAGAVNVSSGGVDGGNEDAEVLAAEALVLRGYVAGVRLHALRVLHHLLVFWGEASAADLNVTDVPMLLRVRIYMACHLVWLMLKHVPGGGSPGNKESNVLAKVHGNVWICVFVDCRLDGVCLSGLVNVCCTYDGASRLQLMG